MKQLVFLLTSLSLWFVLCFGWNPGPCLGSQRNDGARRPNVVFFLVDDLGFMDIACNGSNLYETPNIDLLAKRGTRFTRAYAACGVCSPSRHAIMSGKYPARSGCTNWGMPMAASEFTLAESMQQAGYQTWFIGKWHLGEKDGQRPQDQGFDVNIGGGSQGQPGSYFWPYASVAQGTSKKAAPESTLTRHLRNGGRAGEYLTNRLANEASNLIANRNQDQPFFLFLSFYSVHTPIMAKPNDIAYFQKKINQQKTNVGPAMVPEGGVGMKQVQDSPEFAAMVKSVDDAVGQVLERLHEQGLTENTMVIFTSDNGGAAYYKKATSNLPLRGAKGWYFEGGIRVPLIVSLPGTVPAGISNEKVIGTDFYPTILDLTQQPLIPDQHIDGSSFKDTLVQRSAMPARDLYWYYPHDHGSGSTATVAMISGEYKIIRSLKTQAVQVFDLARDVGEKNDISKSNPGLKQKLNQRLSAWQSTMNLEKNKR